MKTQKHRKKFWRPLIVHENNCHIYSLEYVRRCDQFLRNEQAIFVKSMFHR